MLAWKLCTTNVLFIMDCGSVKVTQLTYITGHINQFKISINHDQRWVVLWLRLGCKKKQIFHLAIPGKVCAIKLIRRFI